MNVAASSEDKKFSYIPTDLHLTTNATYVHITTSNTIEGTEWSELPGTGCVPLIGDVSLDFMAKSIDHSRFHLLYTGAQKNAGPAGVTTVVGSLNSLAGLAFDDEGNLYASDNSSQSDGSIEEFTPGGVETPFATINSPYFLAFGPQQPASGTPEPGAYAMLAGLMVSGLVVARRKRRG